MGKYRGKKKGNKKEDTRPSAQKEGNDSFKIKKENEAFEAYYKSFPLIEDFEQFVKRLQTPLPTAFRFSGSRATGRELLEFMKTEYFPGMKEVCIDGVPIELPFALEWYPGG
jgi:multisite-specific tRNA:(cytosine-C5)-methyltransferase